MAPMYEVPQPAHWPCFGLTSSPTLSFGTCYAVAAVNESPPRSLSPPESSRPKLICSPPSPSIAIQPFVRQSQTASPIGSLRAWLSTQRSSFYNALSLPLALRSHG